MPDTRLADLYTDLIAKAARGLVPTKKVVRRKSGRVHLQTFHERRASAPPASAPPASAPPERNTLASVTEPHAKARDGDGPATHARVQIHPGHPRHHPEDYLVPHASVDHHLDEMHGRVTGTPDHHNEHINNVVSGRAQFVGRGNDGMVFRSGDKAVKVGGVTPFHPHVTGAYRTPEHAAQRTAQAGHRAEQLRRAGVPMIPKTEVHEHAGRTFLVREWMKKPERLTREECDQVQQSVIHMHRHGHALKDRIQVAHGQDGRLYHYDLEAGDVARRGEGTRLREQHPDFERDMEHVRNLYRQHKHEYEPLGGHALATALEQHAHHAMIAGLEEGDEGATTVADHQKRLHELRDRAIKEAHEHMSGSARTKRLAQIQEHTDLWHEEIEIGRDMKRKHNEREAKKASQ